MSKGLPSNRIVLLLHHEKGRGWFVCYDVYRGRKCIESGINAHYFKTRAAALRCWAKLGLWPEWFNA